MSSGKNILFCCIHFGIGLKDPVGYVCFIIVLCLNRLIVLPEQRKQQQYRRDCISTQHTKNIIWLVVKNIVKLVSQVETSYI